MASKTKTILEALQDEIEGSSTLSYIETVFVVQSPNAAYLPETFPNPPFVLIYPLQHEFQRMCIPSEGFHEVKYQIGLSYFQEYYDADKGMLGDGGDMVGATEAELDFQSVLDNNTMSISGLVDAWFKSVSYSPISFGQAIEFSLAQFHATLEYYAIGD